MTPDSTKIVKPIPGSYALILHCPSTRQIRVGRWAELELSPAYYVYVGSALGPGGVRSRVQRHARREKRMHWHIDYLREAAEFHCAWYCYHPVNLEHQWAQVFSDMPGVNAIKGFGCSDCHCHSHLFKTRLEPKFEKMESLLSGQLHLWKPEPNNEKKTV